MSDFYDSQKQLNDNFRQSLQQKIGKAHPNRKLTCEEATRLAKLETIADKLKHEENV